MKSTKKIFMRLRDPENGMKQSALCPIVTFNKHLRGLKKMKNTQKKSRNKYGLLLLALLLIGVASYGTYAYFTDSSTIASDITLKTGTVKFDEVAKNVKWDYVPNTKLDNDKINDKNLNNAKEKGEGAGTVYTNLRPGDYFQKEVEVVYSGSLDATLAAEINQTALNQINTANYAVTVSAVAVPAKPNTYKVNLRVGVPLNDASEKFAGTNGRNTTDGVSLAAIENAVTITAVQSNVTIPTK